MLCGSKERLLLLLARRSSYVIPVEATTSSLAKELGISQQSASRQLKSLEKLGFIHRKKSGRRSFVKITPEGLRALREIFVEYKGVFEMPAKLVLQGRVFSGIGEGSYYTSVKGYLQQFEKRFGYRPYPGTLNIMLDNRGSIENRLLMERMAPVEIAGFSDKSRTYGAAKCLQAILNDSVECVVVFSERTHYNSSVVEVMARDRLRETLGLKDGDRVTLSASFPPSVLLENLLNRS
ncbi:MAG: DUF120 domain-containing protein [Aigarchaeota archaeon]|nr:DUF120 domain-containing protein [Aigarchaeota archaeon]MDH5702725.1 DUF120 domain-containing protein [Aigarchaeota archaeon]